MINHFPSIRTVISDLDGVLWRGATPLPHVAEFFTFLREHGITYAVATNNSMNTPEMYVEKLAQVGVPITRERIVTSAVATAEYLTHRYPPGTPVYIIGQTGLRQALAERGYREDAEGAQVVVVGLDTNVNYAMLKQATLLIRAGAEFVATNSDRTFPSPEGLVPGAGSVLAAIEAATDCTPTVIGKPEPAMFDVAREILGTAPEETLALGDRLDTDILGGMRAGLPTALVLTGITSREEAEASTIRADGIYADLGALQAAWAEALK